ncbi:MAG: molybdenum cofactor biosynthesis protein MoaE [Planctomycetota bacterium]|nr:molybdenum cofactor biosynthesis protein MoaE [Planctomycetota bacterium]
MPAISVKFYGPAREVTGETQISIDFEDGETLADVTRRLAERFPRLGEASGVRLALNRAFVPPEHVLSDGDEVAVIPPVSGGSSSERVALVRKPIDMGDLVADMHDTHAGAVASFAGNVRRDARDGKELVALDYEAYEEMALEQLGCIRTRAIEQHDILDAAIVHRLGRLGLGETSIAVVVIAGHRREAFDACRWIVDAVKADAPIWKKDVWADGSVSWVDPI